MAEVCRACAEDLARSSRKSTYPFVVFSLGTCCVCGEEKGVAKFSDYGLTQEYKAEHKPEKQKSGTGLHRKKKRYEYY